MVVNSFFAAPRQIIIISYKHKMHHYKKPPY